MVPIEDAEHVGDDTQDPTETIVSLEARRAVRDAVAALPERHRDAILLALQGMTPAHIAEQMGIARNAADALLHRARRSLKDRLRVVGEGALGLVTLAYLKIRGGRRAPGAGDSVVFGAFQGSVGAAAAAIVIALNVGAPMQTAVAAGGSPTLRTAKPAAAVLAARNVRAANVTNSVTGASTSTGRAGAGGTTLFNYNRSGDGGIHDGGTQFRVNDASGQTGHQTLAGFQYDAWQDPQAPNTTESLQKRALDAACDVDEILCAAEGATP
jgi:hypothetical protein